MRQVASYRRQSAQRRRTVISTSGRIHRGPRECEDQRVATRIGIDLVGAICGIALLIRARSTVDPGLVKGKVGWAVIAFLGALTSASLGVDAENFMPDVAAAVILITTLAVTRGKVETLAQPSDRLGSGLGEKDAERYSTAPIWAIIGIGMAAYFGVALALGSLPW